MNTVVTSREDILRMSRRLMQEQGWSAIHVRDLAQACGISVGTVYNYFTNQSALLAATVESVWCDIFHMPEGEAPFGSIADCVQWVFDRMREGDAQYPGFFSMHSMRFLEGDRSCGQQLMQRSWQHIQDCFYQVLLQDPHVAPDAFDEDLSARQAIQLLFSLLLAAMVRRDYDAAGALQLIRRMLYLG